MHGVYDISINLNFTPLELPHCIQTDMTQQSPFISKKKISLVSLLIPTLTLKHYCIWAIVTGLTLLMSRNKILVLLMFLVLVLLLLTPLYYLGHVHRICTTYILTDPPPPVSCTTIVSKVTGKTALFSLMLHCFFHPKQLSPLISNTNTLSESRCTTYIQVRLS